MEQHSFDVVIVGAGAAGLMAAWEIVQTGKSVAVLEARDRIGGRIHTIADSGFELPVELGAEFIHGDLELTAALLKKAGIETYKVDGELWQKEEGRLEEQKDFIVDYRALNKKFRELKEDISVATFIETYLQEEKFEELRFTLKNYVEGYYAADTRDASTFALRDELNQPEEEQYRIEGGYAKLMNYLAARCKEKAVRFFLSQAVDLIHWKKDLGEAVTDKRIFRGKKILITVPVGVLRSGKMKFTPALPEKMEAILKLGFGPVIKTILRFEDAFWKNEACTQGKDLSKLGFIFSEAVIPTWWTHYPKDAAMITGWAGGPHADVLMGRTDEEILDRALESLAMIFSLGVGDLQKKLRASHVANWLNDRHSCGGYSYEVVDGAAAKKILKKPVEETLFFAGEGLFEGPEIGTVEAALVSGRDTAHQLIASFKK